MSATDCGKPTAWIARWRHPLTRKKPRQGVAPQGRGQHFLAAVDVALADDTYVDGGLTVPHRAGYFRKPTGSLVYVAYDRADRVLYVGVTDNLFARMRSHANTSEWWPKMHRIEWEEWSNRGRALQREATLVATQCPPYNFTDKPGPRAKAMGVES